VTATKPTGMRTSTRYAVMLLLTLSIGVVAMLQSGRPAAEHARAVGSPIDLAPRANASSGSQIQVGRANETMVELWVDPVNGDDSANGASRNSPLRTITAAWQRIPRGAELTNGYHIRLLAGEFSETALPNYWEDRHGRPGAPIVLQSADAQNRAHIRGSLNMFNVDHVELVDLDITNAGDVFHCEQCRHLVIRNVEMDGGARQARETIKINQSQYITIENSNIHGSHDNAIDFVAVQYAAIRNSRIHNAADWCIYVKGGSAYITVEGNRIFDCGTGGFTAGQGTGFEYMVSPWLHYEAYAVRAVNNLIYNTEGAGLGVNGGYAILYAYNTLYRIGARSHLLEAVHGSRSCDEDATRCQANHNANGWGPVAVGAQEVYIPNRAVFVYNNLIANPADFQSQWQHLVVHAPRTSPAGSHAPSPAVTDDNLRFVGNVIWNGPADHALGVGDNSGCQPSNVTCNAAQLLNENAINRVMPAFIDAATDDFRLANAEILPPPAPIPDFPAWDTLTPSVPAGSLANTVAVDYAGRQRFGYDQVGAFARDDAPSTPSPSPTVMATATSSATPSTPSPSPTVLATATGGAAAYLYLPVTQRGAAPNMPTPETTATPSPAGTIPPLPSTTPQPTGAALLVAIGDSLTEGQGDDRGDGGGFPARLRIYLDGVRPGSTVLNLGRSGWTSGDVIDGVNGEAGQLAQAVAALNAHSGAKVATLWIGSNDLWYLYDARPDPMTDAREQENLLDYTAHLRTIVAQLHATGAVVLLGLLDDQAQRPVVANPPNPAEPAFPDISPDDLVRMSQQVLRYNDLLRKLATENDRVAIVDFHATIIFTDPTTLADDGNHPNSAGYDAIAALWQAALPP